MMKTKSLSSDYRRLAPNPWRSVGAIIVALFLIVFFGSKIFRPVENLLWRLAPWWGWQNDRLERAPESQLKRRVTELEAKLAGYRALETANESLRRELGLARQAPDLIIAEVLPHLWSRPYDLLPVRVGPEVVVPAGALVRFGQLLLGWVLTPGETVVKVKLFSAAGVTTPVRLGPDQIPALALGRGNGNFSLNLPRALKVEVGDWAYVASTTEPLALGVVGAVVSDPVESLQTIYLNLPINQHYLSYVEIARD